MPWWGRVFWLVVWLLLFEQRMIAGVNEGLMGEKILSKVVDH